MIWLGLLCLTLIAPVTVQIRLGYHGRFFVEVRGRIWGMPFEADLRRLKRRSAVPLSRRAGFWLRLCRLNTKWLRWFLRWIRVEYLNLRLRINAGRADATACCWGLGESLAAALTGRLIQHGVDSLIEVKPEFGSRPTAVQVGCILFTRLGNLVPAGLMLAFCALKARQTQTGEEKQWITQSEI